MSTRDAPRIPQINDPAATVCRGGIVRMVAGCRSASMTKIERSAGGWCGNSAALDRR
jgi:hypothetical protein